MMSSNFQLSKQADPNKIFLTKLSEVSGGRFDPHFYKPFFRNVVKNVSNRKSDKLGNLVRFSNESWDQKGVFKTTFPYIEISEIDLLTGEIKAIDDLKIEEAPSRAKMIVRKSDILVSTTRPNRGAISFFSKDGVFIASTGFSVIRGLKTIDVDKRYLFYWLRQNHSLWQMEQRSSGGNYPAITQEELSKIRIPIPPKEMQTEIVAKMDAAYANKKQKETEAQRLLAGIDGYLLGKLGIKLPEQKENTLQSRMFTRRLSEVSGGRFDPFFHSLNKQDKSGKYKFYKLKEIANIRKGGSITSDNVVDGNIPVIAGGQKSPYSHNIANSDGNVITVSASGAYSGYVWYHEDPIYASDCTIISAKHLDNINNKYLFEYLKTEQQDIYNLQQGSGQPHVYPSDLEKIKIPVPPLKKQTEIADHITKIRNQAKQLQQQAKAELEQAKKEVEEMILGKEKSKS